MKEGICLFGFKLVRKSKWKEEQQMLQTFNETILHLDKECGDFVNFICTKMTLDHSENMSNAINRHVSMMDSLIDIYVNSPLSSPLYDINFLKKVEIIRHNAMKLKALLATIDNTIQMTEIALQKLHDNEEMMDDETLSNMRNNVTQSFNEFLDCSKKDLDKITSAISKSLYDIHCGLIHDILRVLMGVDILMEYHTKQKQPDKNNIMKSFRIDVLKINQNKKGKGDSNESNNK